MVAKKKTKYFLGGVAMTIFAPLVLKALKKNKTVISFIEKPASTLVDLWASMVSTESPEKPHTDDSTLIT